MLNVTKHGQNIIKGLQKFAFTDIFFSLLVFTKSKAGQKRTEKKDQKRFLLILEIQ